MAEQQKRNWWSSVPGLLTAATGFVAALSGLVAGLNQLGVFRREEPVTRVEVTAAAPRENTPEPEEHTAAVTPDTDARAAPRPAPATTPAPRTAAPGTAPVPPVDSPAAPAGVDGAGGDTAATPAAGRTAVLPARTVLELATALRVCPPGSGQRRFTGLLAAPARGQGGATLPAGTPAVLRIRRGDSADRPQVRLDSLLTRGGSVAVRRSLVSLSRGAVTDGCLRPGARVRATLSTSVTIPDS